jgi:hypothetical protein
VSECDFRQQSSSECSAGSGSTSITLLMERAANRGRMTAQGSHPLPASFGEGGIRRSALAAPFVASSGEVWVDTTGGITAYG